MKNNELVVKKCMKCGTLVKVINDNCDIKCCDESMTKLIPNSVDAAAEKHVPTYEVKDGKLFVKVNHVMDEDHYIEWITIVNGNKEITTYLKPGEEAVAHCCKYTPGIMIYAYCNKHGLWKAEVQ